MTRPSLPRCSWIGLATACILLAGCTSQAASPPTTTTTARGPGRPISQTGIAHWQETGSSEQPTQNAGEGVATVVPPGGPSYLLYRGFASIPPSLAAEGWGHIGDPDSTGGYIVDAYQGPGSGHTKMFLVTTPSGSTVQYIHTLVAGELYNNSFDAIAPGAQWMVSGEWDTMSHLQIFPTPYLNHRTSAQGGNLPLAGDIELDHPVNDIQGCAFTTKTTLICASDDDSQKLFTNQKPLLEVELPHALGGANVTGHVIDLGSIPQVSTCTGTFEAEGVDYDAATGTLRVEVIQPGSCVLHTTVFAYVHAG